MNFDTTRRFGLAVGAALILALATAPAHATSFTNMYVFGDSLSDTGNISAFFGGQLPLPPYVDGRFSNGPVWVETLAGGLGLGVSPSFTGGNNYAWGGATTAGQPGPLPPLSLDTQVGLYLTDNGSLADPDALYVLWGGGNDILAESSAVDAATNMEAHVTALAAAGATNFLVANLPDIGLTPSALGDGTSAAKTALSLEFNDELAIRLTDLEGDLGINITQFDVFALFTLLINDPGSFGFSNVDTVCYEGETGLGGPGDVCANPDEYLFWDEIHPTAAAHALLGSFALAALKPVPVPAALPLLLSALGFLGFSARRRRS